MASWQETRDKVWQVGDPAQLLVLKVLDEWMEYAEDEGRFIELDVREDMKSDINVFRKQLSQIAFGSGFAGSGGGEF